MTNSTRRKARLVIATLVLIAISALSVNWAPSSVNWNGANSASVKWNHAASGSVNWNRLASGSGNWNGPADSVNWN